MPKFIRSVILSVLFGVLSFAFDTIATEVPKNRSFVNDYAKVIDDANKSDLEKTLSAFKSQSGKQISILTIPDHDGSTIEEFAIKTIEEWKIGKKGEDNGVLVLVSIKEREVRIEVGYGLEGFLTDISSHRINKTMLPYFKEGKWGAGLKVGIPQIMSTTSQDKDINAKVELATKELVSVGKEKKDDLLFWAGCSYFFGYSNLWVCGAIGAYGMIESLPTNDPERKIATGFAGALICILIVLFSRFTGLDLSILFLYGLFSRGGGSSDDDDESSEGEGGKSGGGGSTDKY